MKYSFIQRLRRRRLVFNQPCHQSMRDGSDLYTSTIRELRSPILGRKLRVPRRLAKTTLGHGSLEELREDCIRNAHACGYRADFTWWVTFHDLPIVLTRELNDDMGPLYL